MSPWRWPMARFDRTLARSEKLQHDLIATVEQLEHLVAALNVESARREQQRETKGEDGA